MSTDRPKQLLERLDAIGASLARSGEALALIGLGSAGLESARLDAYSDLDFFAIVEDGSKQRFLDDLSWLSSICPISFCYRNTRDGYRLLFADGIFCEFAVFELPELSHIPFAPGRVIWKREEVADSWLQPVAHEIEERSTEWLVGEALSNLYVGLSRQARGERLAAMRAIQGWAADRALELAAHIGPTMPVAPDRFAFERRYEQRHPAAAQRLPGFMQGYQRNIESARAILAFLEEHFQVNPAMSDAIERLCG